MVQKDIKYSKKKEIKVTAAIPTFGESYNVLKDCLSSLLNQSKKFSEILIVNNLSNINVDELGKLKRVKVINLKKNTGVAGGRNMGIKNSDKKADYIFFFDHDMIAEPNMLEELLKVAESGKSIGIVTPKIYYWRKKKNIWAAGTGINLTTGQVIFRGGNDRGQYDKVGEVEVAPAAILVKREVIKKIKGFDQTYFATYEDTDFSFRARKNGYSTFYAPKAVAYHKIPYSPRDSNLRLLERLYWVGRNRIIFMKRFAKSFPLFLLSLPVFFLYYLLLSLKYMKPLAIYDYLRGTISGFVTK